MKNEAKTDIANLVLSKEKESYSALEVSLEKQLDAWKKNPTWVDEVPEIKVRITKCELKAGKLLF